MGKNRTARTGSKIATRPKAQLAKDDGHVVQAALAQLPAGYAELLGDLKRRIRAAQIRAVTRVNRELVLLYWEIRHGILEQQVRSGWGAKVIDQLAGDLRREFPEMKGISPRNFKYMRAFAAAYPDPTMVQESLAQITWYHNIALLEKIKDSETRLWYARQTVLHGWSRSILVAQIETAAHQRQGKALTNFDRTLPQPQSDLARQLLKDPYTFEFLALSDAIHERELERSLLDHLKQFLIELGTGFAFVGNQYHLEVGGDDFYIDLLFYHLKLRCFVAIDLKTEAFQPEFAGKMNFYLAALDDIVKHASDRPSIGLILCKERNQIVVEYALRDSSRPLGVATYQLLPPALQASLPSPAQLTAELDRLTTKDAVPS